MKVTMNQDDPCFNPAINYNAHVTLNGVEVKMCVEADEESGYVIRYVERERWPKEWILGERDEWPTERIEGIVKIRIPENVC